MKIFGTDLLLLYFSALSARAALLVSGLLIFILCSAVALALFDLKVILGREDRKTLTYIYMVPALCAAALALYLYMVLGINRYSRPVHVSPQGMVIRAGPFLQYQCGSHAGAAEGPGVVVWWFSPEKQSDSHILWGRSSLRAAMTRVKAETGDGRRFQVLLRGLERGKKYFYTLPGFDEKIYSFTSPPGTGDRVRILCVGDTENVASDRETSSYYADILDAARLHYNKFIGDVNLFLHLGDLVKFGSDQKAWNSFFSSGSNWYKRVPFMAVLGNHEVKGDGGAHFDYFFSHPRYYSFDCGPVHILVLHPFDGPGVTEDGPKVSTGREQFLFAQKDLLENRDKKWLIVAMHIAPLSTGDFNINPILYKQFGRLFEQCRVDLVLSGHDHNFDSFHVNRDEPWGGTYYIVAGTGGSRLDSYILEREWRGWKDWIHDRNSAAGLFQNDSLTQKHHLYGELSWGFLDITAGPDELEIAYCRWLSFPRFCSISSQGPELWKIVPFSRKLKREHRLYGAEMIKKYVKKRFFPVRDVQQP